LKSRTFQAALTSHRQLQQRAHANELLGLKKEKYVLIGTNSCLTESDKFRFEALTSFFATSFAEFLKDNKSYIQSLVL